MWNVLRLALRIGAVLARCMCSIVLLTVYTLGKHVVTGGVSFRDCRYILLSNFGPVDNPQLFVSYCILFYINLIDRMSLFDEFICSKSFPFMEV